MERTPERALLETNRRLQDQGITSFELFDLSKARLVWDKNFDIPFERLQELVKSDRNPADLVLMDTTLRPASVTESLYLNDPFSELLENLRNESKLRVSKKVPLNSRLGLSWNEIRQHVFPVVADLAGVETSQVRFPKILEYELLIPFYQEFGQKSDVWEWFEDEGKGWWIFPGGRFEINFSGAKMTDIKYKNPSLGSDHLGFRPVIVFS